MFKKGAQPGRDEKIERARSPAMAKILKLEQEFHYIAVILFLMSCRLLM
jgi:hypothetical protein